MVTKLEIKKMYSLSREEKQLAIKLLSQVKAAQGKGVEFLALLVEAGFNGKKIRAVAHESDLFFGTQSNPQVSHIQQVAEAIFEDNEFRAFSYFVSCVQTVLLALGYNANKKWVQKALVAAYEGKFDA